MDTKPSKPTDQAKQTRRRSNLTNLVPVVVGTCVAILISAGMVIYQRQSFGQKMASLKTMAESNQQQLVTLAEQHTQIKQLQTDINTLKNELKQGHHEQLSQQQLLNQAILLAKTQQYSSALLYLNFLQQHDGLDNNLSKYVHGLQKFVIAKQAQQQKVLVLLQHGLASIDGLTVNKIQQPTKPTVQQGDNWWHKLLQKLSLVIRIEHTQPLQSEWLSPTDLHLLKQMLRFRLNAALYDISSNNPKNVLKNIDSAMALLSKAMPNSGQDLASALHTAKQLLQQALSLPAYPSHATTPSHAVVTTESKVSAPSKIKAAQQPAAHQIDNPGVMA